MRMGCRRRVQLTPQQGGVLGGRIRRGPKASCWQARTGGGDGRHPCSGGNEWRT
jgi:hypothetical protein